MAQSMLVVVVYTSGDRWSREVALDENDARRWDKAMISVGRQLSRNGWKVKDMATVTCFIGTHVGTYQSQNDIAEVLGLEG